MKLLIKPQIKTVCSLTVGTTITALVAFPSVASTFSAEPLYQNVSSYEALIPTTSSSTGFDPTDIYYPESSNSNETFPLAVMLQGALVDKADYSSFASQVASYGFVVAVPNHSRNFFGSPVSGLFPTQEVVNDVLAFVETENTNSISPITGIANTDSLGLLGHSFGGSVGLGAIQNECFPVLCTTEFTRPDALKAGIFYGTRFGGQNPISPVPPIFNNGIPTGLIGGTLDGVIPLDKVIETYEQVQEPPKALITVAGANHYSITNTDNTIREPIRSTLDQEVAIETIARWSGLFLRAHVAEDSEAFNYVYSTGDAQDNNVTVNSTTVPESGGTGGLFLLGISATLVSLAKKSRNTTSFSQK